ncbi:MAG: hypothetical protein ACRD3D_10355 [Terriglobia bacterium]
MALPAVNVPFIGPDFGERMARVTNETTLTLDPMYRGRRGNWFTPSASKYAEWGVFARLRESPVPTAICTGKELYRAGLRYHGSSISVYFQPRNL